MREIFALLLWTGTRAQRDEVVCPRSIRDADGIQIQILRPILFSFCPKNKKCQDGHNKEEKI
jgi:hypothetical protein